VITITCLLILAENHIAVIRHATAIIVTLCASNYEVAKRICAAIDLCDDVIKSATTILREPWACWRVCVEIRRPLAVMTPVVNEPKLKAFGNADSS
jgi:hypothetical protein